jgi:hypothetical protein
MDDRLNRSGTMCATSSNPEILHLAQELRLLLLLLLLLLLYDSLNDCRWFLLKRINPLVLVLETSAALLDVFTAVLIFRSSGMTPSRLVHIGRRLKGACCHHVQDSHLFFGYPENEKTNPKRR